METLTSAQTEFVESVLALKPHTAAFDCDGTLWSGDVGEGFFSWELNANFVDKEVADRIRNRYAEYKAGNVAEDVMCGEMVAMHRGLQETTVQKACDSYFARSIAPDIFPEMQELVRSLRSNGCDVWAVSSSSQWIIRSAMQHFGIPDNRILATEVAVEKGIITDRLIRVPTGHGKQQALTSVLKAPLDCAFGNAIWDREMLAMSKHPFAVNPNPNLEQLVRQNRWRIYHPEINLCHQERTIDLAVEPICHPERSTDFTK